MEKLNYSEADTENINGQRDRHTSENSRTIRFMDRVNSLTALEMSTKGHGWRTDVAEKVSTLEKTDQFSWDTGKITRNMGRVKNTTLIAEFATKASSTRGNIMEQEK